MRVKKSYSMNTNNKKYLLPPLYFHAGSCTFTAGHVDRSFSLHEINQSKDAPQRKALLWVVANLEKMKMKILRDLDLEKMHRKKYRNGFVVLALSFYTLFFSSRVLQSRPQLVFGTTAVAKNQSSSNIHNNNMTAATSKTSVRVDLIHATTRIDSNNTANLAISDTNVNGKWNQTNPVACDGTASNTTPLHANTTTPPLSCFVLASDKSSAMPPTIVIQLRGELGNHMGTLAQGKALQLVLRETYGLNARLVIQPQSQHGRLSKKFKPAQHELQRCFPALNDELFGGFVYDLSEYSQRQQEQEAWLTQDEIKKLRNFNTPENVNNGLDFFHQLWTRTSKPPLPANATISIPFLYTDAWPTFLQDRYYDEIRHLFALNETACCKELPDPDESVFVRSF
jgi:hypothetical protein